MFTKAQALAVTQLLAVMFAKLPVHEDYYDIPELSDYYDFIIVGGGSAGALLANRLSSRPSLRVLLLEAGGVEDTLNAVPLMATLSLQGPQDWAYWTEQQKNACLALTEQRSPWPRGKALGGCSVINFMLYVRGHPDDYNRWSRDHAATGWDWENVLPFFKKFEDQTDIRLAASGMYGVDGEMILSSPASNTPLARAFLNAGKELGYDIVDYNAGDMIGFSAFQTTIRDGSRWSTASAFVRPVAGPAGRKNLHVSLHSTAHRILFEGKRAVGVEFMKEGRMHTAFATREVILSAGVIESPHLLLLSGIGPREQLDKFDIPVIAELPGVGKNLAEHVYPGGVSATITRKLDIDITPFAGPMLFYTQNRGYPPLPLDDPHTFIFRECSLVIVVAEPPSSLCVPNDHTTLFVAAIPLRWQLGFFEYVVAAGGTGPGWSSIGVRIMILMMVRRQETVCVITRRVPAGPWTIPGGVETVAFVQTEPPANGTAEDVPDIEIVLFSMSPASQEGERFMLDIGLDSKAYDGYYLPLRGSHGYNLAPILLHPKSRGVVRLQSADPSVPPAIDPRYLSHPDDLRVIVKGRRELSLLPSYSCVWFERCSVIVPIVSLGYADYRTKDSLPRTSCSYADIAVAAPLTLGVFASPSVSSVSVCAGMKAAARIAETAAFRRLGSRLWPRHFPGCEAHLLWSDPYLACVARHFTAALWHPSGTCKMGTGDNAVVDPQLRVLGGVKGLRVVDASVMPEPLSAHLNGPAMMIAEKAAHMILQDVGADVDRLVPDAAAIA
ncbi:glucose dehydrogenase [FAD, quinone]-like [Amblyomma americanum]